ncbi:MAG: histidine kinase [Acholeplasmataceae bacterium]
MSFYEVFPLIFPGILIQVLFQYVYIKETIKTHHKHALKSVFLSLCIVLFGFPFIAYMHYKNRKAQNIDIHPLNNMTMFYMIIFSYQVFSIQNIFNNLDKTFGSWISVLLGILYILMMIYHFEIIKYKKYIRFLFASVMIMTAMIVEMLIFEFNTQLILINVLALILLNTPYHKMIIVVMFSLGLLAITNIWKSIYVFNGVFNEQTISILIVNLVAAILVFIIFYSFKRQILLNDLLEEKNKILLEQQLKIEKLSIETERYRISHEIHDSVGHHLTAALITLEKMLDVDLKINKSDLDVVRTQVKTGLNQIRAVVHNMNDVDLDHFDQALDTLLTDLLIDQPIDFHIEVETKIKLPTIYKRFLLNTTKEFSTNSLKYGKPKHIDILITEEKEYINIVFRDDGIGTDKVTLGFGLSGIKDTVSVFGGLLKIESSLNEGFSMHMKLPLPNERKDDLSHDKSYVG